MNVRLGVSVLLFGLVVGGAAIVELTPKRFETAKEHYDYLKKEAGGGTVHTMATLPSWDGLWSPTDNTATSIFFNGTLDAPAWRPGAVVKEGVLTPAYENHFKERREEIDAHGEQRYDRTTACEYPGMPRWLWQPYVKEFAHTPKQTWMMNDDMNEIRRIYIGKDHVNIDGMHSTTGDSIGFWAGDKLVIWTKWVNPADYARGMPLTSNLFEAVETWQEIAGENGQRLLRTEITFYDPIALREPQSAVYFHERSPELKEAGVRIRNWECESNNNSYKDEDGNTQFYLPGDPEYRSPRESTEFPEIPGQSLNPIFDAGNGQP